MANEKSKIIYTLTDEAPLLATAAFLPVIRTFAAPAGIEVESSDISLAARILGEFSDLLPESQRIPNNLAALGKLRLCLRGHCRSPLARSRRCLRCRHLAPGWEIGNVR